MAKINLPSDFAKEIAKSLGMSDKWVDEWFDIEEDKQGYFVAKLKPKKYLEKDQFRTMCVLVRDLGGEGYLEGMKAWRVPGPLAKKPLPQANTTSTPSPMDARSKPEPISGVVAETKHETVKEIKTSETELGQIYPVVKDQFGNILDGFHRKQVNPNWKETKVEVADPLHALRIRVHANAIRRTVEPEEKNEWIMEARRLLNPDDPMQPSQEEVAEALGMSRQWVSKFETLPHRGNDVVKRKFDVWNIANIDLEKPFGDADYPGAIPGDIVGNVLLWFLPNGGKVVDPMAGGGVTEDVCRALGDKYEPLLYDNMSLKNYNYRESIKYNDIEQGSLPEEAHGADLIFVDPPYGPLKEYGFESERLRSVLKGLAKASIDVLKPNGYVAVLMQNYYVEGECVGDFVPLIRETAEIFESFGFKQIFEATVPLHGKVARSDEHMTHIDRRLMVFQK